MECLSLFSVKQRIGSHKSLAALAESTSLTWSGSPVP